MEKITTALYDEKYLTACYFQLAFNQAGQPGLRFTASNETILMEHLKVNLPQALLLHLRPDKKEHRRLLGNLKNKFPSLSLLVVLINYEPTPEEIFHLITAGAKGIIPDTCSHFDIVKAIENVAMDGLHCNHLCGREVFERVNRKDRFWAAYHSQQSFTERESRIIHLKKEGRTSAEVGEILHISDRTVDNILMKLYERFNCHSIIELIACHDTHVLKPA